MSNLIKYRDNFSFVLFSGILGLIIYKTFEIYLSRVNSFNEDGIIFSVFILFIPVVFSIGILFYDDKYIIGKKISKLSMILIFSLFLPAFIFNSYSWFNWYGLIIISSLGLYYLYLIYKKIMNNIKKKI